MDGSFRIVDDACREAFERHGAVCLRAVFADWFPLLWPPDAMAGGRNRRR